MGNNITKVRVYGLKESLIASGYPMRTKIEDRDVNSTDYVRADKLGTVRTGTGHDSFLKGITVQFDWNTPVCFQPQILRYHFIDIISSQSTMHRLKKFDRSVFAYGVSEATIDLVFRLVELHTEMIEEEIKQMHIEELGVTVTPAELYQAIIYNLPQGQMKIARYTTNYLQLKTMILQRAFSEPTDMWQEFTDWVLDLPEFKWLCLTEKQYEAIRNRPDYMVGKGLKGLK